MKIEINIQVDHSTSAFAGLIKHFAEYLLLEPDFQIFLHSLLKKANKIKKCMLLFLNYHALKNASDISFFGLFNIMIYFCFKERLKAQSITSRFFLKWYVLF